MKKSMLYSLAILCVVGIFTILAFGNYTSAHRGLTLLVLITLGFLAIIFASLGDTVPTSNIEKVSLKEFQTFLKEDDAVGKYFCKKDDYYIGGYFLPLKAPVIMRFAYKKECIEWLKIRGI